jgi:hypothetical protein
MLDPADHVRAGPEDLRSVAGEVIAVADEAHHDVRKLDRAQDAVNGAQCAFDNRVRRAHSSGIYLYNKEIQGRNAGELLPMITDQPGLQFRDQRCLASLLTAQMRLAETCGNRQSRSVRRTGDCRGE